MNVKYKLDGQKVVPVENTIEWAEWFEKADRTVAKDVVGKLRVSTVFIGLDHNFMLKGPPLLFETMVFDDSGGMPQAALDIQERYATWDEAVAGHAEVLARVIAASKSETTPSGGEEQ